MDGYIQAVLTQLLVQSPMLLSYIAGLVLALVFWRRSVRASVLTLIASAGLFTTTILRALLVQYFAAFSREWGWTSQQLSWAFGVQGVVGTILEAVFFALLLGAVFAAREAPRTAAESDSAAGILETSIWSFKGRIGRGAFLLRFFLLFAVNIVMAVTLQVFLSNTDPESSMPALVAIIAVNLVILIVGGWLSFAMQVKRWHDLGKSGWMVLLNLTLIAIPVVVIILMCVKGTSGPNTYGGDPLATPDQA